MNIDQKYESLILIKSSHKTEHYMLRKAATRKWLAHVRILQYCIVISVELRARSLLAIKCQPRTLKDPHKHIVTTTHEYISSCLTYTIFSVASSSRRLVLDFAYAFR
ncbi:hypothetical protein T4B_3614 [Trichinella pseudospiralis]|uniref:Uncharacterized protein n=1 Tax=Trichinella pseudospiralis TaxID=6337 RepID=A0A0V1JNR6_TRIPS|nr:hypothetical protein T4B_3614 [Trichinella pseudospiralis]KRZ36582.1 hypothetical protein T4C_6209 [Trichinella pseudospiralis]